MKDKGTNGKEGIDSQRLGVPVLSLPKGGGAIRGMGEKFAANPVTGTGSMSIPLAVSPGRSGFSPQLALSYDSGAGNGPFGLGWNLSLPSITRKTDKGLPRYQDAEELESDVFLLSGTEDLVPVLEEDGTQWYDERKVAEVTYRIHRYRPRIEGLFARIERWTSLEKGEIHWRSITRDNITTLYGKDNTSRIFDPNDPDPEHPTRVFSWLICESYDDKGNVIVYDYEAENTVGVDMAQAHMANRAAIGPLPNRYLNHVHYGNRTPYFPELHPDQPPTPLPADWMFEVVFDYGEHSVEHPLPGDAGDWRCRLDPFSSYRAGFEVRTYRLCRRMMMFHHFPDELGVDDYLVRSTEFAYDESSIASFITSVTQSGYVRRDDGTYLKMSLPPLAFEYSQATLQDEIREIDAESLENLPYGLDGALYQWVDLDGEGVSGILTEQGEGWLYKRNLSPVPVEQENGEATIEARFAPVELVARKPSPGDLNGGQQQFLDLAGDGQIDLVQFRRPLPGYFERTHDGDWTRFVPFEDVPNVAWDDSNLKFVDLTGDGHADILISEDDVFTWYPSRAEAGFGSAETVRQALDEEEGPRLVFADGTQSIYLADLSGDGLTDLARIRNGEVCYWSNLGYGRFGAKVTMDNAPWFDAPDLFDQKRIRLADIDGSSVTDILYLGRDGVDVYLNESGNRWSISQRLAAFPQVDDLSAVTTVDLLGNGTACLVWSSSLPGDAHSPMRYVDLMGGQKPHLLVKTVNNLGAETHVQYTPSTKFYLQDKYDGKPWITKLPFPVHVVERVETYDRISRNRFVSRYAYHHGYFDGIEREFRGFGMVEQWDTEEYASLSDSNDFPKGDNIDAASHVPPVHTKTWFHTGIYVGRDHVSDFFAGLLDEHDVGEYYREPGLTDAQARALLLEDTVLPEGLTVNEEREACRALKGAMLRQEVYALDGTDQTEHPYAVTEQNFAIRVVQRRGSNRHAVFFTHPREALTYHYERNPADPRLQHALTLEVDDFGNVLKEAAVGYGRQPGQSPLQGDDKQKQEQALVTYTEHRVTNAIDDGSVYPDDYRAPLPCETRTYELTGYTPTGAAGRFESVDFVAPDPMNASKRVHAFESELSYEEQPTSGAQRRLIEHVRTLYRQDDLTELLPLGDVEPLALPGESFKLAFTPGLITDVFEREDQLLLPTPADVLGGPGADRGGYVISQDLKANGSFPNSDPDDHWWIGSGKAFYSPDEDDPAAQELTHAQRHFFLPHRFRNPFGQTTTVTYDAHDLLLLETEDPLGNRITVGARNADDHRVDNANDYRVLQPSLVCDPNRNRSEVVFDALGLVAGTAVRGKPEENLGDSFDNFEPDLTLTQIDTFFESLDPHEQASNLLGSATTRIVYDVGRYYRTGDPEQPPFSAIIARETHVSDEMLPEDLKTQVSFGYSDGFGREIQQKIQAEPGPLEEGGAGVSPRWVGSGWTVFNNKGKPVRQYEPFFDDTHGFRFGKTVGVSPVLFYDPVGRVVATLNPNHTWSKVVFDPWRQETWDVNDTVLATDPKDDPDVGNYFRRLSEADALSTWHALRTDPAQALDRWPDVDPENGTPRPHNAAIRAAEKDAAEKAGVHVDTPTVAHFDALGRPILAVAHNRYLDGGTAVDEKYETRTELDIEGNTRAVIDHSGRAVMRYDYDLLGTAIRTASMDAGERWMLGDVTGNPIRAWDSRGHTFRMTYDALRRPLQAYVAGTDPQDPAAELLFEATIYGESVGEGSQALNLRSRALLQADGAGVVVSAAEDPDAGALEAYDFKGNLLRSQRRLAKEYRQAVDWRTVDWSAVETALGAEPFVLDDVLAPLAPLLEPEKFVASTTYDALGRPTRLTMPDSSTVLPAYNAANLLEEVKVGLRGDDVLTSFVDDIDYDAKGQRTRIHYGNGLTTRYQYDPETFRLIHLKTTRPPGLNSLGSQLFKDPAVMQDLRYAYDPAGNIASIADDALPVVVHANMTVEPVSRYTYDALYRLIEARGREHIGQNAFAFELATHRDYPFLGLQAHPNDLQAVRPYTERYEYDAVGNILAMIHQANGRSWTRHYAYATESNRLLATNRPGDPDGGPFSATYVHDAHGNMTRMPHLSDVGWDFEDQMQRVDLDGGGTVYFVYDAAGQRVRKVHEHNGATVEERLYLGGYEIYRKHQGGNLVVERETLHIMDDTHRIALVETKTHDGVAVSAPEPEPVIRYQLTNHLGSASLEVDDAGALISYEEYHPYGATSYQAGRTVAEVSLKRYRYTGKERDKETGLYYHDARYYACWLGRWTAADPVGLVDGVNLYRYSRNNPVKFSDPGGTDPMECDPEYYSCLDPGDASSYNTFSEWEAHAPSPMPHEAIVDAWNNAHPNQAMSVAPSEAPPSPIMGPPTQKELAAMDPNGEAGGAPSTSNEGGAPPEPGLWERFWAWAERPGHPEVRDNYIGTPGLVTVAGAGVALAGSLTGATTVVAEVANPGSVGTLVTGSRAVAGGVNAGVNVTFQVVEHGTELSEYNVTSIGFDYVVGAYGQALGSNVISKFPLKFTGMAKGKLLANFGNQQLIFIPYGAAVGTVRGTVYNVPTGDAVSAQLVESGTKTATITGLQFYLNSSRGLEQFGHDGWNNPWVVVGRKGVSVATKFGVRYVFDIKPSGNKDK